MAIHHDKAAYGKLASSRQDLSEAELIAMASALSEAEEPCEADLCESVKEQKTDGLSADSGLSNGAADGGSCDRGRAGEKAAESAQGNPTAAESAQETPTAATEYWDVWNAAGEWLRTAERGTLRAGEYFRIVHAWIADGAGNLLVSRRAMTKRVYPGLWETAGGKVRAGESFLAAAVREVREELGLTLSPACGTRYLAERRDDDPNGPHFLEVWVFRLGRKCTLRPDPAEVSEWAWVSPDTLRDWNRTGKCIPFSYEEGLFARFLGIQP